MFSWDSTGTNSSDCWMDFCIENCRLKLKFVIRSLSKMVKFQSAQRLLTKAFGGILLFITLDVSSSLLVVLLGTDALGF